MYGAVHCTVQVCPAVNLTIVCTLQIVFRVNVWCSIGITNLCLTNLVHGEAVLNRFFLMGFEYVWLGKG